eukprot:SAG11_NODE_1586_length_4636_cov_9.336125_2_plen_112_part_00
MVLTDLFALGGPRIVAPQERTAHIAAAADAAASLAAAPTRVRARPSLLCRHHRAFHRHRYQAFLRHRCTFARKDATTKASACSVTPVVAAQAAGEGDTVVPSRTAVCALRP